MRMKLLLSFDHELVQTLYQIQNEYQVAWYK